MAIPIIASISIPGDESKGIVGRMYALESTTTQDVLENVERIPVHPVDFFSIELNKLVLELHKL